jgi:hypothetical protein
VYEAIGRHNANGILFVAAAGNGGFDIDKSAMAYPAGFGEYKSLGFRLGLGFSNLNPKP